MSTYTVELTGTETIHRCYDIEANSAHDAKEKAIEIATADHSSSYDWSVDQIISYEVRK